MSASLLVLASLGIGVIGAAAVYIGTRGDDGNMLAKVGGSFLVVVGVLGLIASVLLN